MKIGSPYARLVGPNLPTDPFTYEDGLKLLRRIEYFGRISHGSEEAQTEDSWQRFIPAVVMGHGDWSIVEHAVVTADFFVDRGVTHELVRHRLFSFTQSSTRFINYAKKMEPEFLAPPFTANWQESERVWCDLIDTVEAGYRALIALGNAPQIARSVFPNALGSRIAVTGNLRNWRHFLIMRTTKEAHPQMREVTIPLLAEFQSKIPLLFDDIVSMDRQADGMKKAR